MDILYVCDRKACKKCTPECNHTLDVRHAANFETRPRGKGGSYFIERDTAPTEESEGGCADGACPIF